MHEPLSSFLDPEELAAIELMRSRFGVDVRRTYQFWEHAVSRIVAGTVTAAGCPWDVELPWGPHVIRIEVKFSQEFTCRFRVGPRQVFKFAQPKGEGAEKGAHVIVLVGIDTENDAHSWVIPARAVRKSRSITLTSPRFRTGESRSRGIDGYRCPPTQMLPETLRASREHLHHARGHHAETRARTKAAELAAVGQLTLDLEFA